VNNQLQLAINVLEDMIERVDIQAYESPNSEDRVYAGHKWNAFIEARRAMLAVAAINTLAAICRAAAPSAPDTAAFAVGDRVWHIGFYESATVIAIDEDSPEGWIVVRRDGFPVGDKFKYLERNLSLYYDQPQPAAPWPTPVVKQPSPVPVSAAQRLAVQLSKAQREALEDVRDCKVQRHWMSDNYQARPNIREPHKVRHLKATVDKLKKLGVVRESERIDNWHNVTITELGREALLRR
jgi:hypothetical protein